jgi:O-antigen/teichoic acid export membrane protein
VNLDALVVKHVLDSAMAGVYLAGTRLVQAAMAGIAVLASVFLPALSVAGLGQKFRRMTLALVLLSSIGGCVIALIFGFGRSWLPVTVFGNAFAPLAELLPVFGLFVMFRYIAAAPGFVLAVKGCQAVRASITGVSIVVSIVAGACLYSEQGEIRASDLCFAMVLGAISQAALYAIAAMQKIFLGESIRH